MSKKTLNIVESAYRGVAEEQDDTILWLVAAMQNSGAEPTVLLRANAVNYAVAAQGSPGLSVGEWKQTGSPHIDHDVTELIEKRKIPVFVVEEDLADRGIDKSELVPHVQLVSRAAIPSMCAEYPVVAMW